MVLFCQKWCYLYLVVQLISLAPRFTTLMSIPKRVCKKSCLNAAVNYNNYYDNNGQSFSLKSSRNDTPLSYDSAPMKHGQLISNLLYEINAINNNLKSGGLKSNSVAINSLINDKLLYINMQIIKCINEDINNNNGYLIMNSYEIGKSFVGLQSLVFDDIKMIYHTELNKVLKALSQALLLSVPNIESRTIANILLGLKSSTCNSPEVRNIFKTLCHRIDKNLILETESDDYYTDYYNNDYGRDDIIYQKKEVSVKQGYDFRQFNSAGRTITSGYNKYANSHINTNNKKLDTTAVFTATNAFNTHSSNSKISSNNNNNNSNNILTATLDMKQFSTLMRGLKGMSCQTPEVAQFLHLLCDAIESKLLLTSSSSFPSSVAASSSTQQSALYPSSVMTGKATTTTATTTTTTTMSIKTGEEISSIFIGLNVCFSHGKKSCSRSKNGDREIAGSNKFGSQTGNRLLILISKLLRNQLLKPLNISSSSSSSGSNSNTDMLIENFTERHLASMIYGLQHTKLDSPVLSSHSSTTNSPSPSTSAQQSSETSRSSNARNKSSFPLSTSTTTSTNPTLITDIKLTQAKFTILEVIKLFLSQYDNNVAFSGASVGNALYGLQNLNAQSSIMRQILKLIHQKIALQSSSNQNNSNNNNNNHQSNNNNNFIATEYTGSIIAMSCYGLKSLGQPIKVVIASNKSGGGSSSSTATSNTNNNLISSTNPSSSSSSSSFESASQIKNKDTLSSSPNDGSAGSSISGYETSSYVMASEVKRIVNILAERITQSPHSLTTAQLSMAMFGLQYMSADAISVRRMLQALSDKFLLRPSSDSSVKTGSTAGSTGSSYMNKRNDGDTNTSDMSCLDTCLTGKEIAMLLQGMRNMGSEWAEVQQMLFVVAHLLRCSNSSNNNNQQTSSTNSNNDKSNNHSININSHKTGRMTALEIASAINSLQCMGGNTMALPPPPFHRPIVSYTSASIAKTMKANNNNNNTGVTATSASESVPMVPVVVDVWVEDEVLDFHSLSVSPCPCRSHKNNRSGGSDSISNNNNDNNNSNNNNIDGSSNSSSSTKKVLRRRFKPPDELIQVLDALADKYETRLERLSACSVAAALFGLQGLAQDAPPVKRLLILFEEDLAYSNQYFKNGSGSGSGSGSTANKLSTKLASTSATAGMDEMSTESAVSTEGGKKKKTKTKSTSAAPAVLSSNNTPHPSSVTTSSSDSGLLVTESDYRPLDSRSMSNALYGLQNMTSRSVYVQKLLTTLSDAIDISPHTLTAQGVGNSLYGLQNMNDNTMAVRKVLRSLTAKIWSMPWSIEDVIITTKPVKKTSGAKVTMRASPSRNKRYDDNEDSDKDEEQEEETSKEMSQESFDKFYMLTGQNIGNAMWGLRNMTSQHIEVRELLHVLSLRIQRSTTDMNGQNFGNAFYSLHSMSNVDEKGNEVKEVTEILIALANKLVTSTSIFSSLDIGMSLYGLRNMNTDTPIIRAILRALIIKMKASPSKMHLRPLLMAIMGLLKTNTEIRDDFLKLLASKSPGMTYLG